MENVRVLRTARVADVGEEDTEADLSRLQTQIAQRVRQARSQNNMSRRLLSESSGVSQRYLAQLEAADGNISIGVLLRVARALGLKLEWLIGDIDPLDAELAQCIALFRAADPETRAIILEKLKEQDTSHKRSRRICFVGLRGAGKSTLGALAADCLNIPFMELNEQIEHLAGMPTGEVIGLYGQDGYRRLERDALIEVSETYDEVLMAAAGGVVEDVGTYNTLLSRFHTVWLRADPDDHMGRVREQGDERPMAGHPAAMEHLKRILSEREADYSRADVQLDTSALTLDASLEKLVELIKTHKFLV